MSIEKIKKIISPHHLFSQPVYPVSVNKIKGYKHGLSIKTHSANQCVKSCIGSRIPNEHLSPLGLLCIDGTLIDTGHHISLLVAELEPLSYTQIIEHV